MAEVVAIGGFVRQQTDNLIAAFPEVASVHGKIGRADTATEPAPLSWRRSSAASR